MHGISIRYEFDGDEARWRATIDGFLDAVAADPDLAGKFHYRVNKAKEGNTRIHWGWWDKPETVQTLQSRDFFKAFASELQAMAGDTLSPVQVTEVRSTG